MANYSSVKGEIKMLLLSTGNGTSNDQAILALINAMAGDAKTILVWCKDSRIRQSLAQKLDRQNVAVVFAQGLDKLDIGTPQCILFTPKEEINPPQKVSRNYLSGVLESLIKILRKTGLFEGDVETVPKPPEQIEFDIWTRDHLLLHLDNKVLKIYDTEESYDRIFNELSKINFGGIVSGVEKNKFKIPQEGGNIFFDDEVILVGSNEHFNAADFLSRINQSGLGTYTNVLNFLTSGEQDLYHIDLFLTPTGISNLGKKIIFIGIPVCLSRENYMKTTELRKKILAFKKILVQSNLYDVIDIPLPFLVNIRQEVILHSYNNCIVEVFGRTQKVWLPSYSSEDQGVQQRLLIYEREIEQQWEKLGFDVRFVKGNFTSLSIQKGGLHCIVNEVRI